MAITTTNLGKVMPVFKGEYNAATKYLILDEVTKDGNYYRSKRNENLNHAVSDQAWWMLIYNEGDRQTATAIAIANANNAATNADNARLAIANELASKVDKSSVIYLTQAEYDILKENNQLLPDIEYNIYEE